MSLETTQNDRDIAFNTLKAQAEHHGLDPDDPKLMAFLCRHADDLAAWSAQSRWLQGLVMAQLEKELNG